MAEHSEPPEINRERESDNGRPDDEGDEQVALRSIASLERLRDRVESTANEMERLRRKNAELAERVKELETRPEVDPRGTFLSLDHDPERIKERISTFIEAIDSYLDRERGGS